MGYAGKRSCDGGGLKKRLANVGKARQLGCLDVPPFYMNNPSLFRAADGRNHFLTFALVSSLFLLWGFCHGMIDVMDKHFQEDLHLSLAQSVWVQFARYLGYFLMALPAG